MKRSAFIPALVIILLPASHLVAQHEGHGAPSKSGKTETMESAPAAAPSARTGPEHAGHTMPPPKAEGRQTVMFSDYQKQLIGVRTAVAEVKALQRLIDLYGRIEFDETAFYEVNAKNDGYIGELGVNKTGEYIEEGGLLFTLYSPELYQAQEELVQAIQTRKKLGGSWDSMVQAARQRLKLWDVTDRQIDEIARTGKTEKYLRIEAPVSGVVVHKGAFEEKSIKQGETVFKIANIDKVWLEADAYEQDLMHISEGQLAEVTLPYSPGKSFAAKVDFIYPFLEAKTRTTRIRFQLKNPGGKLRPGMYASVVMISDFDREVVVPRGAVMDLGKRQIVYVQQGEGIYVPTKVRKGFSTQEEVQILEGLEAGAVVVASGNFLIDSESQLKATSGGGGHQH